MRGKIDRIDIDPSLRLARVVDYKTGGAYAAEGDTGTFDGGRRLQNIIYTMVARELEGLPARHGLDIDATGSRMVFGTRSFQPEGNIVTFAGGLTRVTEFTNESSIENSNQIMLTPDGQIVADTSRPDVTGAPNPWPAAALQSGSP